MASSDVVFKSPPATEVLQGIFFEAVPGFSAPLQGALWAESFRNSFPHPEERTPIEEITEWFGEDVVRKAGAFQFRVSNKPDAPRIWARSKSGDRILQLQSNAIITNWLKKKSGTEYIHYESRKRDFADQLKTLQSFFQRENLGEVQSTSCLMTYVNHIEVESIDDVPATASGLFRFAAEPESDSWLPSPDRFSVELSYPMPENMGRLYVIARPALGDAGGKDKQPLLRFELTARGQPKDRTIDGALAWLDVGHEWIVKGFVDVTKPGWHEKWEKQ